MILKLDDKKYYLFFAFILPLFLIFLFLIYPILYGFYLSLIDLDIHKVEAIGKFVGLKNYLKVLNSYYFLFSIRQTILFSLLTIPIIVLGSLGISLLLFVRGFKLSKFLQVVILIPWAIPYVVNASMWRWMFDANYGLINSILYQLGLISSYQSWLGNPSSAFLICALSYVWTETPFCALLLLARLQSLPIDICEQSIVDGANSLLRFKDVIFVWLKPAFFIIMVWTTLRAIAAFDLIYVITGGGPADFTAFLSFFIYRETFVFLNFGNGAALSVIMSIIGFIFVILYYKAIKFVKLR